MSALLIIEQDDVTGEVIVRDRRGEKVQADTVRVRLTYHRDGSLSTAHVSINPARPRRNRVAETDSGRLFPGRHPTNQTQESTS